MEIYGLQKLTLLDYPGLVACTLCTGGCDFRCPFCHNAGLVLRAARQPIYTEDTVMKHLTRRQGILDGVCITGGEPLLHADGLADFLPKVKQLGYKVKLDTNGNHPQELQALVEAGLVDYVAMDVKNALPWYARTVGIRDFDTSNVEKTVAYLKSGAVAHEFRTTVVKGLHTPGSMEALARLLEGEPKYYIQPFVDSGDLIDPACRPLTQMELNTLLTAVTAILPGAALRGAE